MPGASDSSGCVPPSTRIWLFSSAHNTMAFSGGEIQPDDIAYFLSERRIARELEGLVSVQLQADGAPDARDRCLRTPISRAMVRVLQ